MSNQFFPTLHTSSWKMSRSPQWQTSIKTAVSGDRKRAPLQEHPRWRWTLKSGVLQSAANDLQAIQNLYTAMYGRLDWFLWKDPEGETIADPTQQINYLGNYYWPVAFTEDSMDFDRFAFQLWECGTCEFEQVMLPQATLDQSQAPNGAVTSATISVLSSNSHTGFTNPPAARLSVDGPFFPDPGGNVFNGNFMSDSGTWTLRTNSATLSPTQAANLAGITLFAELWNTLSDTGSADFSIYDAYITATYEDATVAALRPASATVTAGANGSVTGTANATDGNAGTAVVINRTLTNSGTGGPVLRLSGWA